MEESNTPNTPEVDTTKVSWEEKYGKKKKGKKVNKAIIALILVVALAALGAAAYGYTRLIKKTTEGLGTETLVESYGEQDLTAYINSTGTIESQEVQSVVTTLQYPIKEIKVEVGDRVKAGDTVCIIDDKDINERIDALEAQASDEERREAKEIEISNRQLNQTKESSGRNINKAKNGVNEAEEDYNEAVDEYEKAKKAYKKAVKKLKKATETDAIKKKSTTVTEKKAALDAAEMAMNEKESIYKSTKDSYDQVVEGQKEAVQSAQNSNELTLSNISSYSAIASELASCYEMKEKTIIKAEHDGIVTSVSATEGLVPTGIILQIENDQKLRVIVDIKERDIFKIKEGMDVDLSNDTLEDVTGKGKVSKVINFVMGTSSEQSVLGMQSTDSGYNAVIDINEQTNMLLGMNVKTKIATGNEMSVMAVPYTAIMTDDDGDYVYVAKETSGFYMAERRNIETGETGDYYTEITGGDLEPGDKVILYPDTVAEGGIVKIKE
ncbi:MAG: HlyD family efflux transporter periplasmic adaptor subunit [Eubacterium sp.]|nr:HlyD family efflux transporter periplasmic adaptor subunit [Eubacterium sp.]